MNFVLDRVGVNLRFVGSHRQNDGQRMVHRHRCAEGYRFQASMRAAVTAFASRLIGLLPRLRGRMRNGFLGAREWIEAPRWSSVEDRITRSTTLPPREIPQNPFSAPCNRIVQPAKTSTFP